MRFYTMQHQFSCGIDLHARIGADQVRSVLDDILHR
jgi:hypothetical protein